MLSTVNVRCAVYDQNGNPAVGSNVSAKLSALEISDGYVLPERVSGVTNAQGEVILALWPNALGAVASHYTFQISNPDTGKTETIIAVIPNNDCELHLVANLPAYAGKTDGQLLLEEATSIILPAVASIEANVQIAVDKAQIATTKASEGLASADAALVAQEAAQAAQITASEDASRAMASAELATTKAGIAVASEGVATTKAAEAATSAADTASDAATATAKANEATDAAAAALTSKNAVDVATATATSAAITATTQAGVATTKAEEAIDSATSAAASAASAAASDPSGHIGSTNNPHATTKAQVGLSNVDNTSDANKPVSTAQAAALASKIATSQKDASEGVAGLTAFKLNLKNAAGTIVSWFTTAATAARTWTLPDKSGTIAMTSDITGINSNTNTGDETNATLLAKLGIPALSGTNTGDQTLAGLGGQATANKDASNGYPGLTLFKVNMKNVAGTFVSWLTNTNTSARTYLFPDKDGTVAMTSDITGTNSGTNSGDETAATIKAKLGIVTLSGSNTGDQVLPTVASLGLTNVAKLDTAQTRTAVETMNPTAASSAAYAWAVNTNPNITLTTTGNLTMGAPTGLVAGAFYYLEIVYGGAHTITWDSAFKGVAGIALSSTAAARDAFMFRAQTTELLELVGYRLNVGA